MKKQLIISEDKAKELYNDANPELKELLEQEFGKDILCTDIISKVDSVEAACRLSGKKREDWIPYANPKNEWEEALNATADLWLVAEALREKRVPDYDNEDEEKWYPYFKKHPSGFGFTSTFYDYSLTATYSGARLSVFDNDTATHLGNHPPFVELWNKILLIKK